MRILITSNTYWSLLNFRTNLIKELQIEGHEVIALAPEVGKEPLPCPIHVLPNFSRQGGVKVISSICAAKKILKQILPDIILSFTPVMNVIMGFARPRNTRLISTVNGLGHLFRKSQSKIMKRLFGYLYKRVYKKSSYFVFQNKDDFLELSQYIPGLEDNSLFTKGSGVDLDLYTKTGIGNDDKLRVGYFGRFVRTKGIDTFLQTVDNSDESNFKFVLAGTVDQGNPDSLTSEELELFLSTHEVDYLGFKSNMHEVLDSVDVVMFPSRYREGVPRILLEAAAKGRVILTSNSIGCKDAIEDEYNGFFIRNFKDAVERLELLQKNDKLLKRMGENSRIKAENEFSEKEVIAVYTKAVETLCS